MWRRIWSVLALVALAQQAQGFYRPTVPSRRVRPSMMLGSSSNPSIPRSIKDGITSMRLALQQALRAKQSRMEVTLPRGVTLGVEAPNLDKSGDNDEKADRELARLFVEMFLPIEESVVLAFKNQRQAQKAKGIWGEVKASVTSFEELRAKGVSGKKKKKKSGFGAEGSSLALPPNTEVFIAVAPSADELSQVVRLSESFGMECALIVLNPRADQTASLDKRDQAAYLESFTTVFHLTPCSVPDVQTTDNMLIYRAFPDDWMVAQKPGIGAPRVLARKPERFNREEVVAALAKGKEFNDLPLLDKVGKGIFGG